MSTTTSPMPIDVPAVVELRTVADELHDDLRTFARAFGPLAERVQALQSRVAGVKADTRGRIHEMADVAAMLPGEASDLEEGISNVIDVLSGYRRALEALFAAGGVVDPEAVLDGTNEASE